MEFLTPLVANPLLAFAAVIGSALVVYVALVLVAFLGVYGVTLWAMLTGRMAVDSRP
jgi:hypothetical protein